MRLIDADSLGICRCNPDIMVDRAYAAGWNGVVCIINNAPTVEAAPVVHGKWMSFLDGDHIMPERYYKCSICGRIEKRIEPYCNCGARMDGAK